MSSKILGGALLAVMVALLPACKPSASNAATPSESLEQAQDDSVIEHARKHADPTYVCPMHPTIVRDAPGNCPICGMTLVKQENPIKAPDKAPNKTSGDSTPPIVTVRPETQQNMGLRSALVERGTLAKTLESVGYVTYDEDRMAHVHPRAAGWVERLQVRAEGDEVTRGQVLMDLYSPEIVTAQEEYLLALEGIAVAGRRQQSLVEGSRRRLRLLEVPDSVIAAIGKTREVQETVPVLAPMAGVITRLGLREGMYVKPDMELFTISDVSSVWVQVDVFEHQADQVHQGSPARIDIPALPGRIWEAEVDYIYPELNPMTRTLRIRLRFKNPGGLLKPNMFAHAQIQGRETPNALMIPREALIMTGSQDRVIQDLGDGHFQPKVVVVGNQAQGRVEILEGLKEGDRVVVSGQFLIDSESNLQASFQRMQSPSEPASPTSPHTEN
ncbi:MAG: efflux RND transporter periplasmic adaptor subunit [Gammaproteobacteria bacterium]|nr:efflux RND transporter periplasmic adaptor subunit [Gammaproteobacteria bacterium]MCP5425650.1 efflux RND transporter periplasmic adaptor subunit [Gammaproteobacteria bacterium]